MAVGVATALASRFFVLVRLVVVPLLRVGILRRSRVRRRLPLPPPRADRRTSPTTPPPPLDSPRRGRRGAAATSSKIAGVPRASDVERRRAHPRHPAAAASASATAHVAKTRHRASFRSRRAARAASVSNASARMCGVRARRRRFNASIASRGGGVAGLPSHARSSRVTSTCTGERARRHLDRFLVSSRRVPNGLVLRRRNPGDGIDGAATEPDHHHAGRIDARATRHAANELGRHRARRTAGCACGPATAA